MRALTLLLIFCICAAAQSPTVVVSDDNAREPITKAFVYSGSNLVAVCKTHSANASTSTFSIDAATLTSIVDSSNTATVTTASAHGLAKGNEVTITGSVDEWAAADITSITDATNTSTIVFEAAHGLATSDVITISGITTDTDLNGVYVFTKSDATSGTITTANVTDAAYVPATDTGMAIAVGDSDLSGDYVIATVPSTTTFTITTASVTDGNYLFSGHQFTTDAPSLGSSIWTVQRYEYDSSDNLLRTHWVGGTTRVESYACSSATSLGAK